MKRYERCYVDGAFRDSTGTATAPIVDPVTERALAEVVLCSPADVDAAVASARRGFDVWQGSSFDDRRDALRTIATHLASRTDAIAAGLANEIGCPVWLGRAMQVPMALKGLELAAEGIGQVRWSETVGNGLVERVPAGVVAAITPWNFPLHQITAKVAAAIAAGCSIVLKPSEVAPAAARSFIEAVHAAGLPPGVVNLVWGGPVVGEQLVAHPDVDRISFTGSTAVGRRIAVGAAHSLKPVTLELGGKSAAVLLDDADLDAAMPVVMRMCMVNSGQACVSQSRLVAPRASLPELVERFEASAVGWPLGDPHDDATRLGPLATATQFDHVHRMMATARSDGATLRVGGAGRAAGFEHGWFVAPTLFSDVRPEMEIAQREVFGPVLALMGYDDEAEAMSLVNSTEYGLSGAVWSADATRATRFARGMRTGQVVINGAAQNLATPFGGWGQSGSGRENGRFGIEDLLGYRALHGAA